MKGYSSRKTLPRPAAKEARPGVAVRKNTDFTGFFSAIRVRKLFLYGRHKMADQGVEFGQNLTATRTIPVLLIKQLGHAVPLAKALVEEASISRK
ncbi:MAG TPA: hypothetical protein VKB94_03470 [Rhizomicrobium sp.]|nr:hypothetical protein [Rhizomicrobium sp.]